MNEYPETKTIVILGAGASIPFTEPPISTPELTNCIWDTDKWSNLIRRFNALPNIPEDKRIDEKWLISLINSWKIELRDSDFEEVIEIVDKLSSFHVKPFNKDKTLHKLMLLTGASESSEENDWVFIPFLFRQLIAEAVQDLYDNHKVSDYEAITGKQLNFLEHIKGTLGLSIYSLNYDSIILDSLHHTQIDKFAWIHNEFDHEGLNQTKFMKNPNTIAFLHGQVNFIFDPWGTVSKNDFDNTNEKRLRLLFEENPVTNPKWKAIRWDDTNSYLFNTFITSGRTKDSSLNYEPYSSYYTKLAHDIFLAGEIYVIGYSFQDQHINRLLKQFLLLDRNNRVVIVDFHEGDISIKRSDLYASNLPFIWKALYAINSEGVIDTKRHHKMREDLNLLSYGMAYPQICLYKKGYSMFLEEHVRVIQHLRNLQYTTLAEDRTNKHRFPSKPSKSSNRRQI